MKEEWRDVVGHEGRYQISSYGRVKSLAKPFNGVDFLGCKIVKHTKEKFPKIHLSKKGYPEVDLCWDKQKVSRRVHRLVVEAFHPDFKEELQVDHVDMNKQNNHISNLDMVTNLENLQRSHRYGSHSKRSVRMKSRKRVLNIGQVALIKEMYIHPLNQTEKPNMAKPFDQRWLAKCFKCSQNTIMQIVNNKSCYDRNTVS